MFVDILKVGAISCLSPLQTVLTILIFTKILAGFGTETLAGYGMGSRLEFLLVPIAFAFGIASVPMVGMAMGAGLVARARRVAWTAAAAAGLTVGLIGLVVAIEPALWVSLFTSDPGVTAAASFLFRLGRSGLRLLRHRRLASTSPRRARRRSAAPCWPAPSALLLVAPSAAGGWLIGRTGLDLVCAGRRRDGRIRPLHSAVRSLHALGQMSTPSAGVIRRHCTIRFAAM